MTGRREGLQFIRFMMVLSSLSPLFALWAIVGVKGIPDIVLAPLCVLLVFAPNICLHEREKAARSNREFKNVHVRQASDDSENVLVYLFTVAVPLFSVNLDSVRTKWAILTLLLFVIYMYLHLRLFFMSPVYAVKGYRVFTILPNNDDPIGSKECWIVLSRRRTISPNTTLMTLRLSDTVFLEEELSG